MGVVEGQFRRIAHGGARVTQYEFEYQPSGALALGRPTWSRRLDFTVTPNQQPPTNIHVLIGRNGVGKSHLLRNLVRVVADQRAEAFESGQIVERETESGHIFFGVARARDDPWLTTPRSYKGTVETFTNTLLYGIPGDP